MIKQVHQFTGTGEEKSRIWAASPSQHKDHKWVIMWSAWSRFDGFCRRAKYCDPNKPHMQIYTDWEGWGMQDIIDNTVSECDGLSSSTSILTLIRWSTSTKLSRQRIMIDSTRCGPLLVRWACGQMWRTCPRSLVSKYREVFSKPSLMFGFRK
jgi:hypothetical protein